MIEKEIETVAEGDVRIGFRARRSVLYGWAQGIEDDWYVTRDVVDPNWIGGYSTRCKAREALKKL